MNLNKSYFIILLIVLILAIGVVSANENINQTSSDNNTIIESQQSTSEDIISSPNEIISDNSSQTLLQSNNDEILTDSDEIIEVNNWDELQYYCSLTDRNYILKLKDDTNFYPSSLNDSSCQIKIKNSVKIIGGNNSYIGDFDRYSSTPTGYPTYVPIIVENDARVGLTIENVTFRWIKVIPGLSVQMPDGIFIKIGGRKNTIFKNCLFQDITVQSGHSCIVHLMKGTMILDNCSFINSYTNYGCLSVYGSSPHMIVQNCYFENNYASGEPGCINNCGKLTVYNTTFIKNRSEYWAGAIHTHSGASTTIHDSYFIDNVAGWNGGALYTYSNLKIYNSVFIGNNCTTDNGGGAIGACQYGSDPHVYIEGCLFENNINTEPVVGRGGAISLMDKGSLEVRDSTFISNAAIKGSAICAWAIQSYGSPDVIIVNNSFINHTRQDDVLNIQTWSNTILNVSNNFYYGNSILFSNLTLTKLSDGKEQASFEITNSLSHPNWYDADILNKTLYDVYINGKYVKTVNSTVFSIDFGDLDICEVYVIPTISNRKSNPVTAISTREYIFVSKNKGNDTNNGFSRDTPVNSIKRALNLAHYCQNIIILDGDFSESVEIDYDVTIKGEGNATLTNYTSFTLNTNNFTLKNLNIYNLTSDSFIKGNTNLFIFNCDIKDNIGVLFDNSGFTNVKNSVLLNNSDIVQNGNYDLDYNWWGNTLENLKKPTSLNINNWLVLNATSNVNSLEVNQTSDVQFAFYLNSGVKYNGFRQINLDLETINGTVNKHSVFSDSKVTFTLTALAEGLLTFKHHNIQSRIVFTFLKSNPSVSMETEDIMFGEDLKVTVNVPTDSKGNLTVSIYNQTQTCEIISNRMTFTFTNLKAGNYLVNVVYSGDDKYLSKDISSGVCVSKFASFTDLNLSQIIVDKDLIVTVNVDSDATGNITLHINDQFETLFLANAFASYTIKNISRGDYYILAVYNGDDKYLSSQDSKLIEVDNLNSTMSISAEYITYGETAVVKIRLNDNATGEVYVTVDGITNSSEVSDGLAEVYLNNLDAGIDKNIIVFYTGDDTYFNLTKNGTFTINKADLVFNISSADVMIGDNVIISIQVPSRTQGTFTIGDKVSNIPLTGEVEFIITDLEIGEYDFTATYNGNNYNTVSKTVTVRVCEYPTPQWPNTEANGKSDYVADSDGGILFTIPINESINGITIDSEGNIYITTNSGIYSYDNNGTFRWNFSSNDVIGNFSASVIGRDVIITPKSGDTLYLLNQSSGERYGSSNFYHASSLFAPIIDNEANIYIVSELQQDSGTYNLVKIPYNLWNGGDPILVSLGKNVPVSSVSASDDYIVVLMKGYLRLIDANTLESIFTKSSTNYQIVRPLISENNIIYAVLGDSIVAYTVLGSQLWKTKVTGGVGDKLFLDGDLGLYATNSNGNLYRFDLFEGNKVLISSLSITSGILIDANHNLYFGCDNLFYAMDSEGNVLWKTDLSSKVTGTPVMDKNGVIYINTIDNKVYALSKVILQDSNLEVTALNISEGEDAVITITIDNETTGNVSFTLDGVLYSFETSNGTITKVISGLGVGTYSVNVTYPGDLRFNKSSKVVTFAVKGNVLLNPGLEVTINNITEGEDAVITITIDNETTGNVSFTLDGIFYSFETSNGTVVKVISGLSAGTYNVNVTYPGDWRFNKSSEVVTFNVVQVAVLKDPNLKVEFKNNLLIITLNSQTTGNVSYTINGVNYTESIKEGMVTKGITEAGDYNVFVLYPGDSSFNKSNVTYSFAIKSNATVSIPSFSGSDLTIALPSDATGTLTVKVNGQTYTRQLVNGKASITLPDGSYDAVITYSGDAKYASFTITKQVTVKKPVVVPTKKASKIVAKKKTFKAKTKIKKYVVSLKSGKTPIKKVKLIIKIGKKTFKATTNAKGKATFKIKKLTRKGKYTAKITFKGNKYYKATSKKVKITIK